MNFIAVDFSLNSPGICLYNDKGKKYHFISYMKPGTGTKAEQRLQEELSLLGDVTLVDQPNFTNNESFSSAELLKVKRYDKMADDIINLILQNSFDGDGFTIAFEGTSYGSKMGTNNMIDMAAGAAILKLKLLKTLHPEDILTVAPTTIKKFAGKGNMNKLQLFESFQKNVNEDPILAKSPLWKIVKDLEVGKKIPKPLDDLVDAYFLVAFVANPPS
tara:strand:- start:4181 stop:4831 length:651 start_codon:yes stop_codon:yes gene_type:complete